MKSPAFQFYATDWLGSQRVQMLTLEEEGAYIRLLCSCWQHGSIPSDPDLAARIIGKGGSTTLARVVQAMFQPGHEEGRLIHDRLEAEREKQAAWREKSAAGGRKSGKMRQGWLKGGSRVVAKCFEPNGNTPTPIPSPSTPQPPKGGVRVPRQPPPDSAWLAELEANPAYAGISIQTELGKMQAWCKTNRKQSSRRRFVNWLNRADKPLTTNGAVQRGYTPSKDVFTALPPLTDEQRAANLAGFRKAREAMTP